MSTIFHDNDTQVSGANCGAQSNSPAYTNEEDFSASMSYDTVCVDMTEMRLNGGAEQQQPQSHQHQQQQQQQMLQQQQQQKPQSHQHQHHHQPQQQQQRMQQQQQQQQHHHPQYDGSDSGVDFVTSTNATMQRALSNNSGGYASSGGGVDETTHGLNTMSCGSSMLSCGSDLYELKTCAVVGSTGGNGVCNANVDCDTVEPHSTNAYECCSDLGSESSSLAGNRSPACCRTASNKRKVAMIDAGTSSTVRSTPCIRAAAKGSDIVVCGIVSAADAAQIASASRSRLAALKRNVSLARPNTLAGAAAASAGRQRQSDRSIMQSAASRAIASSSASMSRCAQSRPGKPQKPDSLPSTLNRTQSLNRARTPVTPTDDGRWPGVIHTRAHGGSVFAGRRGLSVTPDLTHGRTRSSVFVSLESGGRQASANLYGTMPRRRKQKSVEDLTARNSRSNSISHDSRMTSSVVLGSRRNLVNSYGGSASPPKAPQHTGTSRSASMRKALKTRIYHETSVQTALTSDDLDRAFAHGRAHIARPVEAAEQCDRQTQSDIRDRELERLKDELRQLAQREQELSAKLQNERAEKLAMQREQNANTERILAMLEMTRGQGAGGEASGGVTPTSDDSRGHDSLLMLESQIQLSGHELFETKQEITELRALCRSLQMEVDRHIIAQDILMEEKAVMEQESSELQEFLQNEKTAMFDALKDLETEFMISKEARDSVEDEVRTLRDECRRLVCLNEQRRQENRMMQSRYCVLEARSKDIIAQQNYAVSNASSALTGLHMRLGDLVDDLVASYNISENELENGALLVCEPPTESASTSSGLIRPDQMLNMGDNLSPQQQQQPNDGSLSPQRNQSFIAAVINAIRNATTSTARRSSLMRQAKHIANNRQQGSNNNNTNNNNQYSQQQQQHQHNRRNYHNERINDETNGAADSDSTEMLDLETEPCLMMDNVLEDVTMPDSHSHNMVSSGMISQMDIPSEMANHTPVDDDSQQALVQRPPIELTISIQSRLPALHITHNDHTISDGMSVHDSSVAEMPSLGEYCSAQGVVDQVIELDGLVTKLLKVLGRLQIDNDNCIHQLVVDKNKLQQTQGDLVDKVKDLEDANVKLQSDLMDASQELIQKNSDLSSTKSDIQRHRNEIDAALTEHVAAYRLHLRERLTEDICNLSTLCSNYRKLSPTTEFPPLPQQLLSTGALAAYDGGRDGGNDAASILNLLRMWHAEGQLKDARVRSFLCELIQPATSAIGRSEPEHGERLRIYANQLENVLRALEACVGLELAYPALQALRRDIEIVKLNANWTQLACADVTARVESAGDANKADDRRDCSAEAGPRTLSQDINANAAIAVATPTLHTTNTPLCSL